VELLVWKTAQSSWPPLPLLSLSFLIGGFSLPIEFWTAIGGCRYTARDKGKDFSFFLKKPWETIFENPPSHEGGAWSVISKSAKPDEAVPVP